MTPDHGQLQQPSSPDAMLVRGVLVGAVVLLLVVLVRTAWVTEDAFITLRTADNFVNGYGLRWNVDERVQVYTHPLWMLLLSGGLAITREAFYTTLAVSIACTLATVLLLACRLARDAWMAALCVGLLAFSRAFMDYSTSGLENPLSHLLLVLFALVLYREPLTPWRVAVLSTLLALLATNRMDLALLIGPAVAWAVLRHWRSWRTWAAALLGQWPLACWLVFATLYYGFPFPNTAYAKLQHGVPAAELMVQGLRYLLDAAITDPVTMISLAVAVVLAVRRRDPRSIALAVGIVLYTLYIVRIGGDYMSGRFLSGPLVVAMCILVATPRLALSARSAVLLGSAAVALGWATLAPPFTGLDYGFTPERENVRRWLTSGVVDERQTYHAVSSLAWGSPQRSARGAWSAEHMMIRWVHALRRWQDAQMSVIRWANVGIVGYLAGPSMHILDPFALCDPLLARLPARWRPDWKSGHFERVVPAGYFESLVVGWNVIEDPQLKGYYDHLRLVTRGPVFDRERLRTVVLMNLGAYDHLIDDVRYRHGPQSTVALSAVSKPRPDGTLWESAETVVMGPNGLDVTLQGDRRAPAIELSLDFNDVYRVEFWQGGEKLGEAVTGRYRPERGGLVTRQVITPATAIERGYNRLRIVPMRGDEYYGLGHVRLLEAAASQPLTGEITR